MKKIILIPVAAAFLIYSFVGAMTTFVVLGGSIALLAPVEVLQSYLSVSLWVAVVGGLSIVVVMARVTWKNAPPGFRLV